MGTLQVVTDNEAPRSFFTRRRLVAGAVLLVLMTAVACLVFGVFEGDSTGELKVSFVRFEKSEDGEATLAVLNATNRSERDYLIFLEKNSKGHIQTSNDQIRVKGIYWKIVLRSSTGSLAPTEPNEPPGLQWVLDGRREFQFTVRLPEDGQRGYVALWCEKLPKKLPRLLSKARELLWNVYQPPSKPAWVMSDEEIQCPKRLPDGTVEPPRLLPATEHQR